MNSVTPPVRAPSPTPYNVLYRASESSLPGPLPTPEEIEEKADVIKQRRARCTAQVGNHYVVKFGSQVDPLEGENMRFVREHVPVPKVYAIYQREVTPRTKITYIIMEDLAGGSLDVLWSSLNREQKTEVALQVRQVFASLRGIQGMGYFGSIDMTKPRDDVFWTDEPIRPDRGTFTSEADFTQAVIDKYMTYCGDLAPQKAEYYSRVLPTVLRGNGDAIFTHNDLRRKNIVIRPSGEIAIIGWASAGWYPSYWEYTKAINLCNWEDDWHEYVGKILQEEYPNQHAWMSTVRTGLWSQRFVR